MIKLYTYLLLTFFVKLPKAGDVSLCGEWEKITFLSIPTKHFTRISSEGMKDAIYHKLEDEQAGFKKKSPIDQIATLSQCEADTTVFVNFVKAVDHFGIKAMYPTTLWLTRQDGEYHLAALNFLASSSLSTSVECT